MSAVSDRAVPLVTATVVDYVFGLRGRALDLPPHYLDAGCEAVRRAHPGTICRRALLYALVSGHFARSRHPLLCGATPAERLRLLREYHEGYRRRVASAAAGASVPSHLAGDVRSFRTLREVTSTYRSHRRS